MIREFTPRIYQQTILGTIVKNHTLVVLPTGLGKTALAFLLAAQRLRLYPTSKILMLAPTKPLCEQHVDSFRKHLDMDFEKIVLFTGSIKPDKRAEMWKEAQIIVSTPQGLENDIINKRVNLQDVSALVFDEAHHATGEYSYVWIAKHYDEKVTNSRILALTASPGSDLEKVKEVCGNLRIEKVEVRTEKDPDVAPYVQKIKKNWVKVEFPEIFKQVQKHLQTCRKSKLVAAQSLGFCNSSSLHKGQLLKLQGELQRKASHEALDYDVLKSISLIAEALKVEHALELLESQGLKPLQIYLDKIQRESVTSKVKAIKNLAMDPNFKSAQYLTDEIVEQKVSHPKIIKLKQIIKEQISANESAKVIIFTQFRDTAEEIVAQLEGFKTHIFVGQAKKNGLGFSQKKQKEVLDQFRAGEFNTLCATSVHPEEYVIIKNPRGQIEIVQIGFFVNQLIGKNLEGWQALTGDLKEVRFYPITNVFKHKRRSKVANVKLCSGFNCTITEDHSLFSFNENKKLISAPPKKNLFVNFLYSVPKEETIKEIDLVAELNYKLTKKEKSSFFCLVKGLNQSKIRVLFSNLNVLKCIFLSKPNSNTNIAKLSGLDLSTITNVTKRLVKKGFIKYDFFGSKKKHILTTVGEKYFMSLKWLFDNMSYHKGKYRINLDSMEFSPVCLRDFFDIEVGIWYGKQSLPRFLKLNTYLAHFLGFYVSEGHARRNEKTSEVYLAAQVKKMQEKMETSIKKGLFLSPFVNHRGVKISSQMVFHLVNSVLRCGIGSYNKEVPNILFSASKTVKWAFLEAYFLGDGYINKKTGRIVLTTVSRKLATGLILMLRQLGIKKITLRKDRCYRVNIYESLPFAKFKNKISRKNYYDLVPLAMINKEGYYNYGNLYHNIRKGENACRKIKKVNPPTHFDYIKEIKVLKEQPEFVYDIEVKKNQKFVGGMGLISLHNSVAEEGLDIPKVDKVIFYEPIPSAIRSIQRRGRTGRLESGEVTILMTAGTRDEAYRWSAHHKEKRMYTSLDKLKKGLVLELAAQKESREKIEQEKRSQNTLDQYTDSSSMSSSVITDSTVAVLADHREKNNSVVKELINLDISVKTVQLESADYLVSGKVAVELKKVSDFVASIVDGRLISQLKELRKNFESAVVIVEGQEDIYSVRRVHANAIRGMLSAIVLDFGVPVLYTKDSKDTAALLAVMAKREQNRESKTFSPHQTKPRSLREQQEYFVSSLPNMGIQTARLLLEHFGTVKNLANASKEELLGLKGVGKKTVENIMGLFEGVYEKKGDEK